jgi:hypothetical protein
MRWLLGIFLFLRVAGASAADPELIVHEWGTFTSLQDESGRAVGGINSDDEPLPEFVHDIAPHLLMPADPEKPPPQSKSIPRCHRDVTMRLETPVIYFHPKDGFDRRFNVSVSFLRGWLTQFFPEAVAHAIGIKEGEVGSLNSFGFGRLQWNDISLGASTEGPATASRVWNAPRQVDAATIEVKGEHEKYLFYRGVGHLDAPLLVRRSGPELILTKATKDNAQQSTRDIRELWLLDVKENGSAAFRVVYPYEQGPALVARTPAEFAPEEYSDNTIHVLAELMRSALRQQGLFEDEANALLNTWQLSYFQSPGLRVFFLVPENWTNETMPLTIRSRLGEKPVEAEITRVMVGRIELVTPQQRALLARLSGSSATAALHPPAPSDPEARFADLYPFYLELGRFRNALLLDEQKQRPSADLKGFINRFGLDGYTPPAQSRRWMR